jgi:hypothetical protein
MLNRDYKDILRAFTDEKVEFLLVGAYAMAAHGYPRATVDIDIWVKRSRTNAAAIMRAIKHFGAPLHGLTAADLQKDNMVFQIGVAPRRIDIITSVSGLGFDQADASSVEVTIGGIPVRTPSIDDLIRNKRATGRTKDLADAEALEALRDSAPPKY